MEKPTKAVQDALRDYMRQLAVSGGRKGGLTRAKNLTASERRDIARKAARARWNSAR